MKLLLILILKYLEDTPELHSTSASKLNHDINDSALLSYIVDHLEL